MKELFKDFEEKLEGEQLTEFTSILEEAEKQQSERIATDFVSKDDYIKVIGDYQKLKDEYINRFNDTKTAEEEVEPEEDSGPKLTDFTLDNLFE